MFRILIALGAFGATLCAAMPADAQYYPGPGYYYDDRPPPPRRYRNREYYAQDPYAPRPYYAEPRGYGGDPMRPRVDPRNGGTYCVQRGFTVQDGVCKPYRGR